MFPSKVTNVRPSDRGEGNSRSRSPDRRRRIEGSHPGFAELVHTVSSSDQPRRPHRADQPIDLFPSKVSNVRRAAMDSLPAIPHRNVPLSLEDRILPGEERTFHNASNDSIELFPEKVPKSLDERISGNSLAERIQEDGERGARELFPEMLRRGGEGRRRRRAEDHF